MNTTAIRVVFVRTKLIQASLLCVATILSVVVAFFECTRVNSSFQLYGICNVSCANASCPKSG